MSFKLSRVKFLGVIIMLVLSIGAFSAENPNLILRHTDIPNISAQKANLAIFNKTFIAMQQRVDRQMQDAMDVPIPKDAGGRYTREQHKRNDKAAGIFYQLTGSQAYAKDLLLKYTDLYLGLANHPKKTEQAPPGRLFWQSLNEAVSLVYSIQGKGHHKSKHSLSLGGVKLAWKGKYKLFEL